MIEQDLRDRLLAAPESILNDSALMRALIEANDRAAGDNVVDLRGVAMERLAGQLTRLEDTHRNVIAAAYDNLAGTRQVHRAILCLLEQMSFPDLLSCLNVEVAEILRVDSIRLVLETSRKDADPSLAEAGKVLVIAEKGFVVSYLGSGRNVDVKPLTLRPATKHAPAVFGEAAIRSEALLQLDLGPGRLPGLLALGAADPYQFKPTHGTDLLAQLAGVFERLMRRWLA
jgi:uncharacterized protein